MLRADRFRSGSDPRTAVSPRGRPGACRSMLGEADAGRRRVLSSSPPCCRHARQGGRPSRSQSDAEQLVDARSAARFKGEEAETRPGVVPGHIPGSRSLPCACACFDADGKWKRGDALKAEFEAAGVDPARPLIVTCGSGITACVSRLRRASAGARRRGARRRVLDRMGRRSRHPARPRARAA